MLTLASISLLRGIPVDLYASFYYKVVEMGFSLALLLRLL